MFEQIKPVQEKIVYVAAHSGGHIIPAITLAKKNGLNNSLFLISKNELDQKIISSQETPIDHICFDLPHTPIFKKSFFWLIKVIKTFFKSLFLFFKIGKCKVITTGSVLSIPVCLAAKITNNKVELIELNVEPGRSTKLIARLADKIYVLYEITKNKLNMLISQHKIEKINYPIKWPNLKDSKKKLPIKTDNKLLVIIGGSQGAESLNDLVLEWCKNCNLKDYTIIHQTGKGSNKYQDFYKSNNIDAYVYSFIDDLEPFYKYADIIISRAGAGGIAEAVWSDAKVILVPLTTGAASHQISNALAAQSEHPEKITIVNQQDNIDNNFLKKFIDQAQPDYHQPTFVNTNKYDQVRE